jgi:hypothetical protein
MSTKFYRRFGKTIPEVKLNDGLDLETGKIDPTLEVVNAKKGSLYLDSTTGSTYQKSGDGEFDWVKLLDENTDAFVTSVNGETGIVVLDKTHIGLDNVDNTADLDKPISNDVQDALDDKQDTIEKGQPLGYASLDGGGKVPVAQLPSAVMTYEGVWNANTNSPALIDGTGDAGMVYRVSVAGTQNLGSGAQTFNIGDYVIYNGSIWEQSDTTDAVVSVNSLTGIVSLDTDDIPEGTAKYFSAALAKSAAVADAISDGVTDVAPSQNVVFDALALKANDNAVVHLTGAEVVGGVKTFTDGILSPSVRTENAVSDSAVLVLKSGDSTSGNSGEAGVSAGAVTQTAPQAMVIQGLTVTPLVANFGNGKLAQEASFQIIVDDTNITNPAAPNLNRLGSSGQRLVARVNSATTIDQLVAAFAVSGGFVTGGFSMTGTGLTTFTNATQNFVGGNDQGETYLESLYRARIKSNALVIGSSTSVNGGSNITSPIATGTDASNSIFILSGAAQGTGNSGGISIRSADMIGSGQSGGTFIRTGSINGSLTSGGLNLATGAATQFSTGGTGGINCISGNVQGTAGSSGGLQVGSGQIQNNGTGSTGSAQLFSGQNNGSGTLGGTGFVLVTSGQMTGTNSGNTGDMTVRTGQKSNGAATGDTGALSLFSGFNAGSGKSGNVSLFSSNTTGTGATGNITINAGDKSGGGSTLTGSVILRSGNQAGSSSGNSGDMTITTGNINASATGASGFLNMFTGNVNNGTNSSGGLSISTGTAVGNASGFLNIQSGTQSGSQNSGGASLRTGNTVNGNAGFLNVTSGDSSGTGNSGGAQFGSGTVVNGTSGGVTILTGQHTGTTGFGTAQLSIYSGSVIGALVGGITGNVQINSGAVTNASSTTSSGNLNISTGAISGSGNSGSINLTTGSVVGGVKGKVNVNAVMKLQNSGAHTNFEDGDIWFDGTDLKMRIGGVTKTFTLV